MGAQDATTLAIDDIQWMDEASAQVLTFAARRLTNLRVLAAKRVTGDGVGRHCGLPPQGMVELNVGPLPPDSLINLVIGRAGHLRSRAVPTRICEMADGNPALALQIADALVQRGTHLGAGEPLPVAAEVDILVN